MKNGADEFKTMLRQKGYKVTGHRLAILQVLHSNPYPMTAEEVFLTVREANPSISLSTVYRNLESLLGKELISRQGFLQGKAKYQLNDDTHHHNLVCLNCHEVIKLEGCPLEDYEGMVSRREDFKITGHNLELYGYCRNCRKTMGLQAD